MITVGVKHHFDEYYPKYHLWVDVLRTFCTDNLSCRLASLAGNQLVRLARGSCF